MDHKLMSFIVKLKIDLMPRLHIIPVQLYCVCVYMWL